MAINPDDITTVRVDQLPDGLLTLNSKIPHQPDLQLQKASVQELVDFVANAVGVSGGVGYIAISISDGGQLPEVPENPSFFLAGTGTYININGYPDVICTDELNAIMSLEDHWELAVGIPIVAEVGVQTVTGSAVDNTDPLNPVIDFPVIPIPTLESVLAESNITNGNDISISDGDAVILDNGSKLIKGTTDAGNGGNNGIALRCSIDYELKWEAGRLYVMEQDGFTIREVKYNFTDTPTVDDDNTKGFVIGSRWILDNDDVYSCTDDTTGAAVWALIESGVPTLQQVLNAGNREVKIHDFSIDGNYTFQAVDKGKFLVFIGGSGYDITIPDGVFSINDVILFNDADGGNTVYYSSTNVGTFYESLFTFNCIDTDIFTFTFETANYPLMLENYNIYRSNIIITTNTTVQNGLSYIANGTLTVTDPTPVTNKGYIVHVIGGTSTIDGVGYTAGALVHRYYDGANWVTKDYGATPTPDLFKTTASGTDTYTATVSGVAAYDDGAAYLVRFTNGNTTGATLNINSIGAKTLYRNNDGELIGGDIQDGAEMLCIFNTALDGFQCIGTSPNSLFAYVTNADSVSLTKGMPVYAFGGTGDRMTVKRALNTSDATSAQTVGLVLSASISAGQKGLIIIQGLLDGLSILPTSTFADGDAIYLGDTAGSITNVKPYAPNHLVYLGVVTTASNGSAGRMYVRVQNGYEMQELHNVDALNPDNNDGLFYNSTSQLWEHKNVLAVAAERRNANKSTDDKVNYCGIAPADSLESAAVWTITRLTISYAGAVTTATATSVEWDDRETATYT